MFFFIDVLVSLFKRGFISLFQVLYALTLGSIFSISGLLSQFQKYYQIHHYHYMLITISTTMRLKLRKVNFIF